MKKNKKSKHIYTMDLARDNILFGNNVSIRKDAVPTIIHKSREKLIMDLVIFSIMIVIPFMLFFMIFLVMSSPMVGAMLVDSRSRKKGTFKGAFYNHTNLMHESIVGEPIEHINSALEAIPHVKKNISSNKIIFATPEHLVDFPIVGIDLVNINNEVTSVNIIGNAVQTSKSGIFYLYTINYPTTQVYKVILHSSPYKAMHSLMNMRVSLHMNNKEIYTLHTNLTQSIENSFIVTYPMLLNSYNIWYAPTDEMLRASE